MRVQERALPQARRACVRWAHPETLLSRPRSPPNQPQVQHTLADPPDARRSMQKAVGTAFGLSMLFYVVTGLAGYLALGDAVPPNVLTAFASGAPGGKLPWLPLLANILVLIHLVPSYQVG